MMDKQALRQTAEKAQEHGVFNMDIHSQTVLALLDEDELKDARIGGLEEALRDKQALLEAAGKRLAEYLRILGFMLTQYDNNGSIDLDVTEAAEVILESAGVALDTGE